MKNKFYENLSNVFVTILNVLIPIVVTLVVTWYSCTYKYLIWWYVLPISLAIWATIDYLYRTIIANRPDKEDVFLPYLIVIQLTPLANWFFLIGIITQPIAEKVSKYIDEKREGIKNDIKCPICDKVIKASEYTTPSMNTSNECPHCHNWYCAIRVDGEINYAEK